MSGDHGRVPGPDLDPDRSPAPADPAHVAALRDGLVGFVRSFGLLAGADRTPCGVAVPLSQAHALVELARGPLTQRDLTRALRLERSTVSRLVDRLGERGWVDAAPTDQGRGVRLTLTEEGRRVAATLDEARARRFRALLDAIPADRRADVVSALALLSTATHDLEDPQR